MTTFAKEVKKYEKLCAQNDVPEETVKAFLVELSQMERYNLYMHYDDEMPAELASKFQEGMERILKQEPMEHVLGYSWFYGYQMIVNEDVLIPRVETEELCAHVLSRMDQYLSDLDVIHTADVGTGSGAIAIAVSNEEPKVSMCATDISKEALVTAEQNAKNNDAKIAFYAGDMLQPLIDAGIKLDVLISNPPYIPCEEEMEKSVVDFEPHVALFGGNDGLQFYRSIFANCKKVLNEKSFMAFEMGWNQRENMTKLVQEYVPDGRVEFLQDMNGKDRMFFVYFNM